MKRLIFLFLLTLSAHLSYAQVADKMIWIEEVDKYVVALPKVVLYEIPQNPNGYSTWVKRDNVQREVVYYDRYKKKSLKKPQTLLVRGYANGARSLEYDAYIVEYNNKRYLLPQSSVEDNSLLLGINSALREEYEALVGEISQLDREVLSMVATHKKICKEKIAYHKMLKNTLPAVIDSVRNVATEEYLVMVNDRRDKWYAALPKSTKNAYAKLSIADAYLSGPNSASGCDYTFVYTNKSNKTIKYLYWEGEFYNAVNDPVHCDIRGNGWFRGRDTGPVEPGESGGGVWECVIYNWSADHLKLSQVTINYMDGTTATIGARDLERLILEPTESDLYDEYGSVYDYAREAVSAYSKQLSECDGEISKWNIRQMYLERGNYMSEGDEREGEYKEIFKKLSMLYNRSMALKKQLEKFETKNLLR